MSFLYPCGCYLFFVGLENSCVFFVDSKNNLLFLGASCYMYAEYEPISIVVYLVWLWACILWIQMTRFLWNVLYYRHCFIFGYFECRISTLEPPRKTIVLIDDVVSFMPWDFKLTAKKMMITSTASHAGTHTQNVYGSRYDSMCNTFAECKKIELMNTFTQNTSQNLHHPTPNTQHLALNPQHTTNN